MARRYKCLACTMECILSTRSKPLRLPDNCLWIGKPKWEKYNQRLEAHRRRKQRESDSAGKAASDDEMLACSTCGAYGGEHTEICPFRHK